MYKAKDKSNNWVYGYFVKYPNGRTVIISESKGEEIEVKVETVSRSLGEVDKKGNPLYVNDMVNDFGGGVREIDYNSPEYDPQMAFPPMKITGDTTRINILVEEDGTVRLRNKEMSYSYNISKASKLSEMELIGNIYDN